MIDDPEHEQALDSEKWSFQRIVLLNFSRNYLLPVRAGGARLLPGMLFRRPGYPRMLNWTAMENDLAWLCAPWEGTSTQEPFAENSIPGLLQIGSMVV
eukprot:28958-Pyramimonas_sp.AAC.1